MALNTSNNPSSNWITAIKIFTKSNGEKLSAAEAATLLSPIWREGRRLGLTGKDLIEYSVDLRNSQINNLPQNTPLGELLSPRYSQSSLNNSCNTCGSPRSPLSPRSPISTPRFSRGVTISV